MFEYINMTDKSILKYLTRRQNLPKSDRKTLEMSEYLWNTAEGNSLCICHRQNGLAGNIDLAVTFQAKLVVPEMAGKIDSAGQSILTELYI